MSLFVVNFSITTLLRSNKYELWLDLRSSFLGKINKNFTFIKKGTSHESKLYIPMSAHIPEHKSKCKGPLYNSKRNRKICGNSNVSNRIPPVKNEIK